MQCPMESGPNNIGYWLHLFCRSSSKEKSFAGNITIQSTKKSEAVERSCMAEHSTDKLPAQIIEVGHATPHRGHTSGESGEGELWRF